MNSQLEHPYVVRRQWLWNIGAFLTRIAGKIIQMAGEKSGY